MSDIRAAAESLAQITPQNILETTARKLAEIWLVEHPADDDELLDNDWITANVPYRGPIWRWDSNTFAFDIRGRSAPMETRGDVRRLLAALGGTQG